MQTVFRFFTIMILTIVSSDSYGCFVQPLDLVEEHKFQVYIFLAVSGALLFFSILLRWFSSSKRIWIPLLFAALYGYYPFYLYFWDRIGASDFGGSCGIPGTVEATKVLAIGLAILFGYELFVYVKSIYLRRNAI